MTRPFFIVGCERSGTTLVRLMLDSHPQLAVPPESHFVVEGPGPREDVAVALERILRHRRFEDWHLDAREVRGAVASRTPATYAELLRCVYGLYAQARGKRHWGDKTPRYVHHIPRLIELFPDAQFIHVIRDGHETTASVYDEGWIGSPISAADWWRRAVAAGRRSRPLGPDRYHELRLERLIAAPARTLAEVCEFLDEPFSPLMLEYHRDAGARESPAVMARHRALERPPTAGLRDWTAALSPDEQLAVRAVCARPMKQLGFAVSNPPVRGYLLAWQHVLRTRAGQLVHPEWRPEHAKASATSGTSHARAAR